MKRLGYYPALVVLMTAYITIIGICVVQSVATLDRMKQYKSSGEMVKMSQAQLEDEQRKLADNQKIDKLYNDYFARWVDKEGKIDEAKLKQKLQKMAEDLGLNVVEMVPLSTQESGKLGANGGRTNSGGPAVVPGMPPYIGAGAMSASKSFIEMKITLLGSFQQLMVWMEKAENELGSMRFVQSRWIARSPDEVRLTVGFRYRMIEDLK